MCFRQAKDTHVIVWTLMVLAVWRHLQTYLMLWSSGIWKKKNYHCGFSWSYCLNTSRPCQMSWDSIGKINPWASFGPHQLSCMKECENIPNAKYLRLKKKTEGSLGPHNYSWLKAYTRSPHSMRHRKTCDSVDTNHMGFLKEFTCCHAAQVGKDSHVHCGTSQTSMLEASTGSPDAMQFR